MLIAVLTVSDRCSRGEAEDTSGPAAVACVRAAWPEAEVETGLVPDEEDQIAARLEAWCALGAALVLTTGGTGLSPRDHTPEATRRLLDREAPGLAEAMRARGAEKNTYAWLSRGVAGLCGQTLLVNLPGSRRAVEESLDVLLPLLRHGLETIRGGSEHPRGKS